MLKTIRASDLVAKFVYAYDSKWGYIWGQVAVLWTEAKQRQKVKYMESTYGADWKNKKAAKDNNYYYAALYGAKWVGHIVADCSGLFVWAFKQLGGSIYHGSNTIYDRYCSAKGALSKGKRTDGKELKPGTAVFTYNEEKKKRGYIGLYIGGGWVIEASGTSAGVIKSKITASKWKFWGELKNVDYGGSDTPDAKPTLRKGDKGAFVTLLQSELIKRGFSCGVTGADGDFGKNTESAVKAFQKAHGLKVDGIVGASTWDAFDVPEKKTYAVTVKGLTGSQAQALQAQYPNSEIEEERG